MENFTILTFNISEVNSNFNKINKEQILNNLKEILQPNLSNIYFISSQEDEIYSKFIYYIKKIFNPQNYFFYESAYISPFAKILGNNYNIHSLIIIPKEIMNSNNIKIKTIKKINHNNGYTKGSLLIKLSTMEKDVYLISSHLPMSNKTSDLGYNKREKSVINVLNYINNIMNQDKSNYLLWTGDLNFRIDVDIDGNKKDQIKRLLIPRISTRLSMKLEDLSEINKNEPTCKTIMNYDKIECDRTCGIKKFCKSCYDVNSKKGNREPSYCDRVLGWSNVGTFVKYKTETLKAIDFPFIQFSDHNPIISRIELPKTENDNNYVYENNPLFYNKSLYGGNLYKNKLNKYKHKYNYILDK